MDKYDVHGRLIYITFSLEYLSFLWQELMGGVFRSQHFHFFFSNLRIRFNGTVEFLKKANF